MVQLYFLSIFCNGLSAYIFITKESWDSDTIEAGLRFSVRNELFRLILGILTAITGLLKLLSPYPGSLPILGDLIPALGGLAAGFILVFGYYRDHVKTIDTDGKLDRIGDAFLKWKKALGFVLLVSVILHFLFPQALFL
ncbi:MAG: hypothetical protein FWF29_02455 [Treponema sp.]|nr:hypothetical protein [Treponema sp.]